MRGSETAGGWLRGGAVVAAVITGGALGPTAVAGPVRWEAAAWNRPISATPGGWFTSADRGTTVVGRANAAYPTQAYLEARYCNSFGANTRIVGLTVTRTRHHTAQRALNGTVVVLTPQNSYRGVTGGATSLRTTQRFLKAKVVDGIDLELHTAVPVTDTYRFPGGGCVASRVAVRGGGDRVVDTPGFVPRIVQRLRRVLVEDLQGPAVADLTAPSGWITADHVATEWVSSDNAYRRGTTGVVVTGAGRLDLGDQANGRHRAAPSLGGLADGPQQVCVYRRGSGWTDARTCRAIRIDRTNPSTPPVTVSPAIAGYSSGPVTVTTGPATDGTGSGWSRNQIRLDGGGWHDIDGSHVVTADGEHTVQARAVDRSGRVSTPTAAQIVRVDRTPPVIADLRADGLTGRLTWKMSDAIGFGDCHVTVALSGPGTYGALVTTHDQPASSFAGGSGAVTLPVGSMPNGRYAVRLAVCDSAGNHASAGATLDWTGNPDGVLSGSWARFVPMRLVSPGSTRHRRFGAVVVPIVRRTVGQAFVVTGRLQRPDGTAFANAPVEVRDGLGRYVTGFRTAASGAFHTRVRARVGGAWTVNSVGSRVRQPLAWLEVRPVVRAGASMRASGRLLVVRGRMRPGSGVRGKAVSLQWFDLLTRQWRPVVDGRVRAGGSFTLSYRFTRSGHYTVAMRVVVPRDSGWPYLTGRSRPMRVAVRG